MLRRAVAAGAMAAALTLGAGGTAWAHECFNASRSDQGNAGAANSQRWFTATVEGFVYSPDFPPDVDKECFLAYWRANGGPESFTIFTGHTLTEGSSNPNLADGRGIDHIEDAYGGLLGAGFGACG
ncbi:hypothetical protein AB0M28_37395 [Streptomyces sp. NPDC051940]|uniref:hypothetical protein n=1 Tax=Streptomyces sp. NPDC051940 TaxID=3155675 RepID=UPI003440D2D7